MTPPPDRDSLSGESVVPRTSFFSAIVRRPFRSLRWRLEAWHALVLATVLIAFGFAVDALSWESRLQQIDAELDQAAEVIGSRIRRLFPGPFPFSGQSGQRNSGRRQGTGRDNSSRDNSSRDNSSRDNSSRDNSSRDGTSREVASRDVADAGAPRNTDREPSRPPEPPRPNEPRPNEPRGEGRRYEGRGFEGRGFDGRGYEGRGFDPNRPMPLLVDLFRGTSVPRVDPRFRPPMAPPQFGSGFNGPGFPPGGGREGERQPPSLDLPDEVLHLFEGEAGRRMYYAVWDRDGKLLEKSASAPDSLEFPNVKVGPDEIPVRVVRMMADSREVIHTGRMNVNVLIGRSLTGHLSAQRASRTLLILVGMGVLAAGLAGGWWVSGRAMRPIANMTATAESISVQHLSQRIDLKETDSELDQLAKVLNRTFDRLQAAFERQAQFTADASHELRTPLTAILAKTELSLARPRTAEEYRATIETCRRASQRMKLLIDGLLELARFDTNAIPIQFASVNLNEVVADAVDLLDPLAQARQIELVFEVAPSSVIIQGDKDRLAQVLLNLLMNAIRYNKERGEVRITVKQNDNEAIVAVADTGIGIPADELPHIFERFYRVDKVRLRSEGSCGLGLSICQKIVESHGGTISVRSEVDVGTTMEIHLPIRTNVSRVDAEGSSEEGVNSSRRQQEDIVATEPPLELVT